MFFFIFFFAAKVRTMGWIQRMYKEAFWASLDHVFFVKLRQGSGKDRQGLAPEAKGLKPLPRAYTKVGCHPPTTHP